VARTSTRPIVTWIIVSGGTDGGSAMAWGSAARATRGTDGAGGATMRAATTG
jgi:hypothetical protein